MGIRIFEVNVFARLRGSGVSHVRMGTCWEFLRNLLVFRFSKEWRQNFQKSALKSEAFDLSTGAATPKAVAGPGKTSTSS
jgi:hypothetical protein